MVNHEIKWNNNTVFSVESTEENKHHHHHCSTENKITSLSFPPFQEDIPNEVLHHLLTLLNYISAPTRCKLEVMAMVCSNLVTSQHLTNETRKGNRMISRMSSVKCKERTICSFIAILSAKAECMYPAMSSFFSPNVSNSLLCSSWGLNEAPRHIPEQGRLYIAEYATVHNPETKKFLHLLTAEAVYTWSSHSLRTAKVDSLQPKWSTHTGICAHHS